MAHPTLAAAAARRFPLLGRPRPDCPPLPIRLLELAGPAGGIPEAAHILNKAALIASDAGLPDLAGQLCWQHIRAYLGLDRPLSVLEGRYLLEPVLNLARLRLRADDGDHALHLLTEIHSAVVHRTDMAVDGRILPTSNLTGEREQRRALHEWVWLQFLTEGIRAHALHGRWADAANLARAHHGVGRHLMDGRQAAIIAGHLDGDAAEARRLLADSHITEPWEQQVAACLTLMDRQHTPTDITAAVAAAKRALAEAGPTAFASYRVRVALTAAILSGDTRPDLSAELLHDAAEHAIHTADGYAARDVLHLREPLDGITAHQYAELRAITHTAGVGRGELPAGTVEQITVAVESAAEALHAALRTGPPHTGPADTR